MPRTCGAGGELMPESRKIPRVSDEDLREHFGVEFDPDAPGGQKDDAPKTERPQKKQQVSQSPLDLKKVVFTFHALERLQERYKELGLRDLADPEKTALRLLTLAKEEGAIGRGMKIKRLIKHGFEEARYFMNSGWRFVVVELDGKFVVTTIERKSPAENKVKNHTT